MNPNTGAPEAKGLTRQVARNTLYVDAEHPSHVILPVIPCQSGLIAPEAEQS